VTFVYGTRIAVNVKGGVVTVQRDKF